MATCFCGCDEKVKGMAARGMNKQGRRTVEQVEKLTALKLRSLQLAEDMDELDEVLPGSELGKQGQGAAIALTHFSSYLGELIAVGDGYANEWHSFIHDDYLPVEGVVEYKREWLDWGKICMSTTPILKASDEDLISVALAIAEDDASRGLSHPQSQI